MSDHSTSLFIVSSIAVVLSLYSVYVEDQAEKDDGYEALCDINPKISCTRVFTSEYGTAFGFSFVPEFLRFANGVYGVALYSILAGLSFSSDKRLISLQFFLSVLSVALSVYLGYILFFVLRDFCVVCVSTYVLNVVGVYLSYAKLHYFVNRKTAKLI